MLLVEAPMGIMKQFTTKNTYHTNLRKNLFRFSNSMAFLNLRFLPLPVIEYKKQTKMGAILIQKSQTLIMMTQLRRPSGLYRTI